MGFIAAQAASSAPTASSASRSPARPHPPRAAAGDVESEDLNVTFHVIGTAIREDPSLAASAAPAAQQILSLTAVDPAASIAQVSRKERTDGL